MTDPTATAAEILKQAKDPTHKRTAKARVLLLQDLAARHAELEAELGDAITRDAITNEPDRAPAIRDQINALEEAMRVAEVEFVFRSIGRKRWADLLAKHPPTKAQVQADRRTVFNPETFPIVAIAESCISPEGMDEALAREYEQELSDAQFSLLWNACIDANLGGGELPKSLLAAGLTRRTNERSATTAAQEESLEASS